MAPESSTCALLVAQVVLVARRFLHGVIELLGTNPSTSGEMRSDRYLSQTVSFGKQGSAAEAAPLKLCIALSVRPLVFSDKMEN